MREPSRIQTVLAADQAGRVARGETLFADQCATCHGKQGEGDIGPALNAKNYLSSGTTARFPRIFRLVYRALACRLGRKNIAVR